MFITSFSSIFSILAFYGQSWRPEEDFEKKKKRFLIQDYYYNFPARQMVPQKV